MGKIPKRNAISISLKALISLGVLFIAGASFPTMLLASDTPQKELRADIKSDNPFVRFLGEWTLKDDKFQYSVDGTSIVTQTVPNHHTLCEPINTINSVFCTVDGGDVKGQIYWVYNAEKKVVHHLSHFREHRSGVGIGTLSDEGDLRSKIVFQDEPDGTYRIYEYNWVSDDEYHMISRHYGADDKPTGGWYGGYFIRITR